MCARVNVLDNEGVSLLQDSFGMQTWPARDPRIEESSAIKIRLKLLIQDVNRCETRFRNTGGDYRDTGFQPI